MNKHKWHKEIKAWADGEYVEWKDKHEEKWKELNNPDLFNYEILEFRIKPQPKEPQYLYVYFNEQAQKIDFDVIDCDLGWLKYIGKIKLEVAE